MLFDNYVALLIITVLWHVVFVEWLVTVRIPTKRDLYPEFEKKRKRRLYGSH